MSRARLFAGILFFWAGTAGAALPDEIQVYTDDLERAGERGIELHVNTTPSGRSRPDYPGEVPTHHGVRVTPEISWGLGHDMDWGLYLPFVRAADGSTVFAGPRFRLKWMPLLPGEGGGWFAGLNGELAFVQQRFDQPRRGGELRPILGYRSAAWLVAVNPNLEFDLAGPDSGVLTRDSSSFLPCTTTTHAAAMQQPPEAMFRQLDQLIMLQRQQAQVQQAQMPMQPAQAMGR